MLKVKNREKTDGAKALLFFFLLLIVINALCIPAGYFLYEKWLGELVPFFILSTAAGSVYMLVLGKEIRENFWQFAGLHIFAFALIVLSYNFPAVYRPVIGAAMLVSVWHGFAGGSAALLYYSAATVLFGCDPVESLLLYLIFGIIACYTVSFIKSWRRAAIAGIFLICCYAVVYEILFYYSYMVFDYRELLAGLIGGLLQVFVFVCFLPFVKIEAVHKDRPDKARKEKKEQDKAYMDYSFPPMEELKERNAITFKHTLLVAEISYKAALAIQCDAELAKAGAMYHEVGQGLGEDYIKESIKLCRKYKIPSDVQRIVKEHNTEHAKAGSKEAAIVMLSDTIISTMERNRQKSEGQFSDTNQIIEKVFQVRESSGDLDKSKLSEEEIQILMEIYKKLLAH